MHCIEVGLEDPSTVGGDALQKIAVCSVATPNNASTYNEWIKTTQTDRNVNWQLNVLSEPAQNTVNPPEFTNFSLFHDGA